MSEEGKNAGGRPSYRVTAKAKRRVAIAAGAGMSHEDIALALGIARNTLEKHFALELSAGAHERRLDVIDALYTAATAEKPSAAAARAYLDMGPVIVTRPPAPMDEGKPERVGKKEQAQQDARSAADGTGWGTILPGHA